MVLTGSDYKVVGLVSLQHEPHCFDIIPSVTPISPRLEGAKIKVILQTQLDSSSSTSDFTRHKCFAAPFAFVGEADSVAGKQTIRFAIIHRDVISVGLCTCVRRTWMKGREFRLWYFPDASQ